MRAGLLTTDSIIGSDALVLFDGRWNAASIDRHVRDHIEHLRVVQRGRVVYGYTLYRGSLLDTPCRTVTFPHPITF